jgi:ribosome-binding protein aMBF1 (putative translation factor)
MHEPESNPDACDNCGRTNWTVRVENAGLHLCGPCYAERLPREPVKPSPTRKPSRPPRR